MKERVMLRYLSILFLVIFIMITTGTVFVTKAEQVSTPEPTVFVPAVEQQPTPVPTISPVQQSTEPATEPAPVEEEVLTPEPTTTPAQQPSDTSNETVFEEPISTPEPTDIPTLQPSEMPIQTSEIITVYFYTTSNTPWAIEQIEKGNTVPKPYRIPEVEGYTFVHWYQVDEDLNGNENQRFLFDTPVYDTLMLKAYYKKNNSTVTPTDTPMETELPVENVEPTEIPMATELPTVESTELPTDTPLVTEEPVENIEPTDTPTETEESTDIKPETNLESSDISDIIEETPSASESDSEEEPATEEVVDSEGEVSGLLVSEIVDMLYPERVISIYMSWGDEPQASYGDTITLTAVLSGYEGLDYTPHWQSSVYEENGWQDVPDATSLQYSFILDENNILTYWRLVVDIHGGEGIENFEPLS